MFENASFFKRISSVLLGFFKIFQLHGVVRLFLYAVAAQGRNGGTADIKGP
jgi:hypothetical protein